MSTPIINLPSLGLAVKRAVDERELQRLAELGRLSASLLHEIANPLTAAMLHIEQCDSRLSPNIRQARRSIRQLQRNVEAARQQARLESTLTAFGIRPQVAQVKRIVLPLARHAGVRLVIAPLPACRLYGDPVKFQQALANLLINAVEAYAHDSAPRLDKAVDLKIAASGQSLRIRVTDWGVGINAGDLEHIFDLFYTTKKRTGHGLGVGLALVKQYVTADFGGSISVRSSRRGGTVFTLKLPAPRP